MVYRILACLPLSLATRATQDPFWTWYPVNSEYLNDDGQVTRHDSDLQSTSSLLPPAVHPSSP